MSYCKSCLIKNATYICFIIISCPLLWPISSHAQEYQIQRFDFKSAYGNVIINEIFQDSLGLIWLGTTEGLIKFDGRTYLKVPFADSTINEEVTSIYQDKDNVIWVGYKKGKIAFINPQGKLEIFSLLTGLPEVAITGLIKDQNGTFWIATYGQGIYYLVGEAMHHIGSSEGLNDDYIYVMVKDKNEVIWVGTDRGLSACAINDNQPVITNLDSNDGLKDNIVKAISNDTNGDLIIGLYEHGFCRYDIQNKKIINEDYQEWEFGIINQIEIISDEEIWIATENNGLLSYNQKNQMIVSASGGTSSKENKILSILRDMEGNIWYSDNDANLNIVDPRFKFYDPSNFSSDNNTFCIDKEGSIWFPEKNGFTIYKPNASENNQIEHVQLPGLPNVEKIISSHLDDDGILWIGTYEFGVYRYDTENGNLMNINESHGLVNNNVLSINGNADEIWFATLGGVSRYYKEHDQSDAWQFQNFDQEDGLGTNYIYQVFIDSRNRAWFATHGEGIAFYSEGKIKKFDDFPEIATQVIYSITEDINQHIWFSTANGELFKFNGEEFLNISPFLSLEHSPISSIMGDENGNLMIVFIDGLGLLDQQNNFFSFDNKLGEMMPGENLNAVRRDRQGNIWIVATNGLINFKQHLAQFQQLPYTTIENVEVFFENIDAKLVHQFDHTQNHISFACHSSWYQNIENIVFEYMLEGYDLNWQISNDRIFTYPRLPPGKYSFFVKSSLKGESLASNVARYDFEIKAPFWQSPWFYASSVVIIGLILYFYIKIREERLKHEERLQKDIITFQFETLRSQVNPHFLFNSFNTLIAIIEENQKVAVEYVSKLSDFFRNILTYRKTQVITIEEELALINDYYFLQKKRYGENFSLKINVSESVRNNYIPPMTLQLLTENALKHNIVSKKRPISIEIFDENDKLIVQNNVNKKNPDPNSTGMGLENIKNRYLLLSDKKIEITQTDQLFKVTVPLLIKSK